jgi:signal transduction histidine kinase
MSTGPVRLDTRAGDEAPDTRAWLAFALHASGASRWEIPIPEDTLPLTELWQRLTGDERATAIPRADLARLREPLADLLEGRLAEVSFEFRYTGLDGQPCPRRSVMRLVPSRPPNGRPALLRGLNFARIPPSAAEAMPDVAPEIAREADRRFETFSRAVADELRAPTRAISGFAHRLDKLHGEALPGLARELLTRLGGAARAMDDAVEALADFARLAGAPLEPKRVDLADLARRVWQEHDSRDEAHAARLEIDCRAAPLVRADPALVRIVLRNLLDNARKFSRNYPRSVVSFAWSPGTPSHFFVRDRGAGFDLANATALFEPFGRQHSPSEFEGIGIGLATVRLLIERHGGRVWAESRPGEGATFRFTLPSA